MFNSIAYSQITGISNYQKRQIAKGLIGYDKCRVALDSVYKEKKDVEYALGIEKQVNNTYKVENQGLTKMIGYLENDVKNLKSSGTYWKIFGVLGSVGAFYFGYKYGKSNR